MFHRAGEQLTPVTLSEARKQRYVFDLTDGRLIFRTPYGQPDSLSTTVNCRTYLLDSQMRRKKGFALNCGPIFLQVNGVTVEVVHPTLFSRQSWVVLLVDLMAACSMRECCDHSWHFYSLPSRRTSPNVGSLQQMKGRMMAATCIGRLLRHSTCSPV